MTLLLLLQALSFGPAVDSLATAQNFSGIVLIAQDGKAVTEKAYGMADREAGRANNIETAFNLGSINKFFTQIAIRQLAEQGKLNVDSTLGTYWPDYPNAAARRVTIRQLLEHRSGIGGNIFAAPAGGKRRDIRKLSDYLPLFVNESPQFEPGAQQQYSNAGYIVLGLLVERLSGENYYAYVQKHIYQPAEMTRTAHWAIDSLPANTALGYTRRTEDGGEATDARRNSELLPGRGSSAGGGYSTAHDLLRFINALRDSRIPGGPGLGFGIAGGAPGLNAVVETALPGGYDVIVLANLDPPAAERMGRALRERIRATP
jgi:CubicO group peptidase (beta-lactamase class C family)